MISLFKAKRLSAIFILILLGIFNLAFATGVNNAANPKVDYKIRHLEVEILNNQEVVIPDKIFKIWHALTTTIDFEVGGGIDFNFAKQVERIKMSYGEEKSVTFLPDFEIGWHTHPAGHTHGTLMSLRPPSVEDVMISIAGNYNLWLITTGKIAADYSNALVLQAYSEHVERLYVVELNFVADPDGVYMYRADNKYWENVWQSKQQLQTKLVALKDTLQPSIDKYVILVAEKKLSAAKAREELLAIYHATANLEIVFLPWEQVLKHGLHVKLNLVELLQHRRKQ